MPPTIFTPSVHAVLRKRREIKLIPEIGHFALILALCAALIQATLPLWGAQKGDLNSMALARPAAYTQFLFLAVAFICLSISFVNDDFSVLYVASNSNTALPIQYKLSAVWGAHEGSLLLWALILGGWTAAVATFSRSLPRATVARVLAVMGMISIGFLSFMLFTSDPFQRLIPAATEGRDLNPLLQDPGLIIHPPMLYMGYVGFSVAFAFASAALIGGHLDTAWARWSRPWTTVAWLFLTIGITLGSWWSYYELGWGGWWFWDPVENASFMPWLVGTALIHTLAVTEKRGLFKSWTVLLALITFSLSLLGTFLVRSGVLTSVHSFASDPTRGLFILMFLMVVIGGSMALYAWRGPSIRNKGQFALLSKETLLLVNNIILVIAAASVMLGTLYPLAMDALKLGKISVGPPYFDAVFIPLMIPLLLLVPFGPFARWKQDTLPNLLKNFRFTALVSIVAAIAITVLAAGKLSAGILGGVTLGLWLILASGQYLWDQLNRHNAFWSRLKTTPLSTYGMILAHLGVGVFVIGVTITSNLSIQRDLRMDPGETVSMAGYDFQFQGTISKPGPNYQAEEGLIRVLRDGKLVTVLYPQKRVYRVQRNAMTEAAIDDGFFRHLYVALGEPIGNTGAWAVRLYYKPLVFWIWLGPAFMALGGLLATFDRRYRKLAQRRSVSVRSSGTETA